MALCMIVGDMQSKSDRFPTTTDNKRESLFSFLLVSSLFTDGGQKAARRKGDFIDPEPFYLSIPSPPLPHFIYLVIDS